jgi:hypothetical protein
MQTDKNILIEFYAFNNKHLYPAMVIPLFSLINQLLLINLNQKTSHFIRL